MTSTPLEPDFCLGSYRFDLPEERIAQAPALQRGASRLLVLRREAEGQAAGITMGVFADILRHLPDNCLLIANNSRVIPARVQGHKASGGKVEFLLLTPPPLLQSSQAQAPANASSGSAPWQQAEAEGLLRSSKKVHAGDSIAFAPGFTVEVLERGEFGRCRVRLYWQGNLLDILSRCGVLPLPPYIKRTQAAQGGQESSSNVSGETEPCAVSAPLPSPEASGVWGSDAERYQTTYARADKAGSVAAPTAGLHFTPELRKALADSGREWAEVTLYVGYGTFSPVRSEDIREHAMHAEYVELSEETARAIAKAKAEGRPVIAVGTTSARVLEGVFAAQQAGMQAAESSASPSGSFPEKTPPVPAPFAGWINIFMYPGKQFNVIDGLITNFHLPESSLLMLVSALAGRENVLRAYTRAIDEQFNFFSYGDAMLIL